MGLFDIIKQEITISNSCIKTKSKEAEVVLHEILHGICYNSNVLEGIKQHEEHIVDTVANGIILVLKDNPLLIDYFKEMLNDK